MIHPTAEVDPSATVGEDCHVWGGALIQAGVVLGPRCSVGRNSELGRDSRIGEGTRISFGVFLPGRTVLGRGVFLGPGVIFTDDRYPRANNPGYRRQTPVVEDDVAIGAGAVILPGVRLGRGCLVGAGSVVTCDVEPYTIVYGNPARPVSTHVPRLNVPDAGMFTTDNTIVKGR